MTQYAGISKLRPGQYEALLSAVGPCSRVLEVGTLHGVTAARLASDRPEALITSIDTFAEISASDWLANRKPNQACWIGTLQQFADFDVYSLFDMIFVDADHHYKPCLTDLEISSQLLAHDGRLFAHDYGFRDGVTRAVDDFCAESGCRIIDKIDTLVELGR